MDETNPQRAPGPGMTRLRHGDRIWEMPDAVWEMWVRRGLVPPDALVLSSMWTRGIWRRADNLEVFHLYRPSTGADGTGRFPGDVGAAPAAVTPPAASSALGHGGLRGAARELPQAIWGSGLSVTQALVLVNLLVAGGLIWTWRDAYDARLWALSGTLHTRLFAGVLPALLVPLFLHAGAGHLLGNMVGLIAGGAAVEEFYGRARTLGLYLFAGFCGAAMSLLRVKEVYLQGGDAPFPILSVGASGAVMGLYAIILVFLLRYRRRFSERQQMKTVRIYVPLLAIALLPSLFGHDLLSHLGGFLGGIAGALLVPPHPRRVPWGPRGPGQGGAPPDGNAEEDREVSVEP